MIAERSSGVTVQGNISGDQYRAGIDDENMAHIINLFTDLYSDQEMAVVREYSTNARDAQIEAGVSGPIRVTLPTSLVPQFTVEDSGVGLSADDIRTIYSRYGTSTKRATNDQNGMLGLGCKSALTYAEQFTVESVKDGVLTICMISRGEDGVPVFTVVSSVPTDRPSGTKVVVPVRRYNEFEKKVAKLFKHWPKGSVLVNDKEPARQNGLWITDDICLVKRDGHYDATKSEVVMGGVAYPVEGSRLETGLPSSYRVIAHVPIGAVSFTPSREALMYTSQTKATLASLEPRIKAAVQGAVQKEIDKATTAREAIRAMLQWRDLAGNASASNFKFKGADLPEKLSGSYILVANSARKLGQHEKAPSGFLVEYATDALFVTGYTPTQFTATHKRKLLQLAEDENRTVKFFALTDAASLPTVVMEWIDASQVTTWEKVKATVLPKNSTAGIWRNGRPTGTYDAIVQGTFQHIAADEIEQDEPIFYCRGLNRSQGSAYASLLAKHFPTSTVVFLPENRYEKFKRFFPEAKTHRVGLQEAYDAWTAALPQGTRLGMAIREKSDLGWLRTLDPARVDDPTVRRAIHVYRNTRQEVEKAVKERSQFDRVIHAINLTEGISFRCPLKRYKVVDSLPAYRIHPALLEHIYLYMNAAYAAGIKA